MLRRYLRSWLGIEWLSQDSSLDRQNIRALNDRIESLEIRLQKTHSEVMALRHAVVAPKTLSASPHKAVSKRKPKAKK
jgi:hypothetical protein